MRTSLKTYVKRVREAISTGDATVIANAVTLAQKNLDKAAKRGVIHPNQAARRKSRIMAQAAVAAKAGPVTPVEEAPKKASTKAKPKAAK
jgi:small subunit ribosomal protein S20